MVANYEYKIINGEEISVDCLIKIIIGMTSEFTQFSIWKWVSRDLICLGIKLHLYWFLLS